MKVNKDRGTGRTTEQIKNAPHGAVFVWCNDNFHLLRNMAHELGRDDLMCTGPGYIEERMFLGLNRPIVMDHDVKVSHDAEREVEFHNSRVKELT